MRALLFLYILLWKLTAMAQFSDQFTDKDFSGNPPWFGDSSSFEIDSLDRLHLKAPPITGKAQLVVNSTAIINASWVFDVHFAFNPSSSNQAKVYLCSDNLNLIDSLIGYYVLIGGSADEVSLYRQIGKSTSKLIDGVDKILDRPQVNISVKVTVNDSGKWALYVDTLNTGSYYFQGEKTDLTVGNSRYFGVLCEYTQTRCDKFWFDNFEVTGQAESTPPSITTVAVDGLSTVRLRASEKLDELSIFAPNCFRLLPSGSVPINVDYAGDSVLLLFDNQPNGSIQELQLTGIKDLSGNVLADTTLSLLFLVGDSVLLNDILITEVLFDPTPIVGLPDAEYVEIYNNSSKLFDLGEISFWNSNSRRNLNRSPFFPGEYRILCHSNDSLALSQFAQVSAVSSWAALTNTADSLQLTTIDTVPINELNYSVSWHSDPEKKVGGWSLEMTRTSEICKGSQNFESSLSSSGGTPGAANSQQAGSSDTSGPEITAYWLATDTVFIQFTESIWPNPSTASIVNLSTLQQITNYASKEELLWYILEQPILPEYTFIFQKFEDCLGNLMSADTIYLTNYNSPKAGELVINEIMADPTPSIGLPAAEYVEVFNRSSGPVNLKGCSLNGVVFDSNFTLPSGAYVLICNLLNVGLFSPELLILSAELGASFLSNGGESLSLKAPNGDLVSSISYSVSWYGSDSYSAGGYSLELSNPYLNCENFSPLWSASKSLLGGSPGGPNNNLNTLKTYDSLEASFTYFKSGVITKSFSQPIAFPGTWTLSPPVSGFEVIYGKNDPNINFHFPPEPGVLYTIEGDSVVSCLSPRPAKFSLEFKTPVAPGLNLVINEVLYDPIDDGSDFIELVNISENYLLLNGLLLSNQETLADNSFKSLDTLGLVLEPNTYLVICSDTSNVRRQYQQARKDRLYETNIPNFPNNAGIVCLTDSFGIPIDLFHYSDTLHHSNLITTEGVSLERVFPTHPTNEPGNWTSASQLSGFSTPGFKNSAKVSLTSEPGVSLSTEVITPNGDGQNDEVVIRLAFPKSDLSISLNIYNASGIQVKNLLTQEPVSGEIVMAWNGNDNDGQLQKSGVYVVVCEVFGGGLNHKVQKKAVVLSN